MEGWIKYFSNGTSYVGDDVSVACQMASWRNSQNTDIVKVEASYGAT